jgi:serine/threonine-protein kinase RIO1
VLAYTAAAAAAVVVDGGELDAAAALQQEQQQAAAEQQTLREIDNSVDDFVTMVNLSVLFNPGPLQEMTCYNLVTGERADCVPAIHWQQVGWQWWQEVWSRMRCGCHYTDTSSCICATHSV